MSRVFLSKKEKMLSMSFPLCIDDSEYLSFSYKGLLTVDSMIASNIIELASSQNFTGICGLGFIEEIDRYQGQCCNEYFWSFFRDLISTEDGYLRYDYDMSNFKKLGGELHPLNHYDLFYSSNVTFKLGLNGAVNEREFLDMLNTNTKCKTIN